VRVCLMTVTHTSYCLYFSDTKERGVWTLSSINTSTDTLTHTRMSVTLDGTRVCTDNAFTSYASVRELVSAHASVSRALPVERAATAPNECERCAL
jgi:hypothetical protein